MSYVSDEVLRAYDKGMLTDILLLDFSKAFDTINHKLLYHKLHKYNFSCEVIEWFQSYLTDRRQITMIETSDGIRRQSAARTIDRGVPQGSILGPLIFTIYVADLPSQQLNSIPIMYADDTQLLLPFFISEINEAIIQLQGDLNMISTWSTNNSLLLNALKTKLLIVDPSDRLVDKSQFSLMLSGNEIQPVQSCKSLGIVIDTK